MFSSFTSVYCIIFSKLFSKNLATYISFSFNFYAFRHRQEWTDEYWFTTEAAQRWSRRQRRIRVWCFGVNGTICDTMVGRREVDARRSLVLLLNSLPNRSPDSSFHETPPWASYRWTNENRLDKPEPARTVQYASMRQRRRRVPFIWFATINRIVRRGESRSDKHRCNIARRFIFAKKKERKRN